MLKITNKENNYLSCLLLLTILTLSSSCQTPDARRVAQYVGRPTFANPCIANGDGTCFENGELRDTTNMICGDVDSYDEVQTHLENVEFRLYVCLRSGRRCR